MKNIINTIIAIVIVALPILPLFGQDMAVPPRPDAGVLLSREHVPVIFSGSDVIDGSANTLTSDWMQIGYAPIASNSANRNIGNYNPQHFTAELKLECFNVGDSAEVSTARAEFAMDTVAVAGWNADSSNSFIEAGSYTHAEYGSWRHESLVDTSRRWNYPIKVQRGGYIRLVFETTLADSTTVNWSLICEH